MTLIESLRPLRNILAGMLVRSGYRIASDEGWARLTDSMGAPGMLAGLLRLRDRGFAPERIADVGACQGDWTRLCHQVFPAARVLMVEPQSRHRERLQRLSAGSAGLKVYRQALLGPPGMTEAAFHVLDDGAGTGSSILPELSDVPRHREVMSVMTLDDLVLQTGFGSLAFLKADVQGFELEVLKGATRTLGEVQHVLLEVSIVPYNEGSPLIDSVLTWMRSAGFGVEEVFDLSRARDGRLVQADLLFSRLPR
jgi:FkbM family methyltransferase